MRARKLEIRCPVCQSADVVYTCTPNCCFNHVCASCGATFEPVTKADGGALTGWEAPEPAADASGPTAACARCDKLTVWMTDGGGLFCGSCGSLLELEITEVHPG